MIYKIIFEDKNYVIIDFFDNHGASIVTDYLKKFKFFTKFSPIVATALPDQNNKTVLYDYFNKIKKLGYDLPFELTDNITQQNLNQYHRFFTENSVWAWHYNYKQGTPTNPYDKNFQYSQIPSYKEWLDLIHGVNTYVHNLESSVETKNKRFIKDNNLNFFFVDIRSNDNNIHNPTWIDLKDTEIHSEYTKNYHKIILSEEIQGKSYLRAFIDNDDPTCDDITGHLGTYGGFSIDLSDDRKKIYESNEFSKWLKFYNLNLKDTPLEYPIGNLIETSMKGYCDPSKIKNIQIQ